MNPVQHSFHPAQRKRQSELLAFFWHKSDVSPESVTWLFALDRSPGLSSPSVGIGTHCCASQYLKSTDPAYPTPIACFSPAPPAGFQGPDAIGFWPGLSDSCLNTDLKISSECLSPAITFQSIFRATSSFGFLRNCSSFFVSELFPSPVQTEVSSFGNAKVRGSSSCSEKMLFSLNSSRQRRDKT